MKPLTSDDIGRMSTAQLQERLEFYQALEEKAWADYRAGLAPAPSQTKNGPIRLRSMKRLQRALQDRAS